ncbi:MAG TPA: ABC transporter permease [Bryobacteraceae bacterium]|nr:ABC transporter permease [Bryobacteraceae bacterium]
MGFLYDLKFAFRALRRNPVLTFVALFSLALGIGANTAIFSIMDRLFLRALPVREPQQLVVLTHSNSVSGFIESNYGFEPSFSWPKYKALRDNTSNVFDGLIARFPFAVNLAWRGQSDPTRGELVSGNYFDVLGIHPALGRLIENDDTRADSGSPVAVLSHSYWMNKFGGSRSALNQPVIINGHAFTIVGVAQAGFQSVGAGEAPAVFVPITMQAEVIPNWSELENAHAYWLNIFGRLRPGFSAQQAQAALAVVWSHIIAADVASVRSTNSRVRARYLTTTLGIKPAAVGISEVRGDFAEPIYVLMGMVGLVLLIVCANIANLLLARAAAREKEIAIRLSLGASRGRLWRHLLAESAILSFGGALGGLIVASWAGSLILRLVPHEIPLAGISADPDLRVLAFALGAAVVTGLLFGCVPALRATRPELAPALREQAGSPSSAGHARVRKGLVVAQIALSVLLLASAGAFAHSLYNLRTLNPGFRVDHLIAFTVNPPLNGYDAKRSLDLFNSIEQDLAALPGVSGASMATEPLLGGAMWSGGYNIEGVPSVDGRTPTLNSNRVSPGFFSLMGIPLISGRDFTPADRPGTHLVAIVNETLAKTYFPDRSPLGMHVSRNDGAWEIVGVVKDAKYDDLREKPKAFIYFAPQDDKNRGAMTFYVRSQVPPETLFASIRQIVKHRDPNLPIVGLKLMTDQVGDAVFLDRMVAALSMTFACLATLLASIGLYGVIAWAVTRRKREIGIRIALGAASSTVIKMVFSEVLILGGIGIAIALPLWLAAGRVFASLLFGVSPNDALTITTSIAVLSLVAGLAGFIPAWRASRIDPISAIRYE